MTHLPGARRRPVRTAATLAAAALALAACGSGEPAASAPDAASEAAAGEATVSTAFGEVAVPADPQRVVTLAENALDVALSVGVTPVGTTASRGGNAAPAYLGEAAAAIPVVATVAEPNLEAVLEAEPDLILAAAGLAQEQYDALTAIAPTVVPDTATGGDWQEPLHVYAQALGADDELTADLDAITARAEAVAATGSLDGSAAVLRWMANGAVVMNSALMPGSLLQAAGADPLPVSDLGAKPHSDPLSLENLGQVDADRLFVAAFGADGKGALEAAKSQPAFTQLSAVQAGTTSEVDGSVWSSASGPTAAELVMDDIEAAAS